MSSLNKICTDFRWKSLPALESPHKSASDSGIDSDASSTKLSSSSVEMEMVKVSPYLFLQGAQAPLKNRIDGINKAIFWITEELSEMKCSDKKLAKIFIRLRSHCAEERSRMGLSERIDAPNFETSVGTKKKMNEKRTLTSKDAFPIDGKQFERNKRVTWAL